MWKRIKKSLTNNFAIAGYLMIIGVCGYWMYSEGFIWQNIIAALTGTIGLLNALVQRKKTQYITEQNIKQDLNIQGEDVTVINGGSGDIYL